MTHFPPELIEAARVSYGHANSTWRKNGSTWGPWEKLTEEGKQMVCADFAVGLRSLIPVSDGVLDAMVQSARPRNATVAQGCDAEFAAAITYLAGDGK